jgi:hypothetical protein
MLYRRIALSAATFLIAAALFGEEPECASNYHSDGKSSETFVLTTLAPKAVIERLPRLLIAAGASMQWSEPEKGILKAEGLDVRAETSGNATRVTFRSSTGADKTALCRYASLVGNPPAPPLPPLPQDPALIELMKDDLIMRHEIVEQDDKAGLNNIMLASRTDFLELTVRSIKQTAADRREYGISMLLPRTACNIMGEDMDDVSAGFGGRGSPPRTKPVRVEATVVYLKKSDNAWHFAGATISHMESTK